MRKLFLFITAIAASLAVLQSCEERTIKFEKLPAQAQAFIQQYFPTSDVILAEMEKDDGKKEYKVKLGNGTELDFNADGEWTSVDCEFSILPDGILLPAMSEYISTNFPEGKVYKIEKELGGYEVGITMTAGAAGATPDIELVFDTAGNFIR